jgi:hypothetical protein
MPLKALCVVQNKRQVGNCTDLDFIFISKFEFGPKRDEVTGGGENFIMRSFMICTPHPILRR